MLLLEARDARHAAQHIHVHGQRPRGAGAGDVLVQRPQGLAAGVVERGDGEHGERCQGAECDRGDEDERSEAVHRCAAPSRPDVRCGESGGGGEGGDCVDDEAGFFVWLEAVEDDEGHGGEGECCRGTRKGGEEEGVEDESDCEWV